MRLLRNEIFPLKKGHLFAVVTVSGQRGEKLNLFEVGVSRPLFFFHEFPKSNVDCSYFQKENCVELGGVEMVTEQTLYLIAEK